MPSLRLNSIMTVSIRYLWSRPGTETLWFKRKVPKDLVDAVGKTWLQFSLGTKDPRQAARLIEAHATAQNREWDGLRSGSDVGVRAQAHRLLASNGVDTRDPKATPEALRAFEDFLEDQLPRSVLEDEPSRRVTSLTGTCPLSIGPRYGLCRVAYRYRSPTV